MEYRDAVQSFRDGVGQAKAGLELNLARVVEGSKKDFYKYINKRNTRENTGLLLNSCSGALVTQDLEKAKILNDFFTSTFSGKASLQGCQAQEISEKV